MNLLCMYFHSQQLGSLGTALLWLSLCVAEQDKTCVFSPLNLIFFVLVQQMADYMISFSLWFTSQGDCFLSRNVVPSAYKIICSLSIMVEK